jgi:hypothetical protein
MSEGGFIYKIATEESEFQQIFRLNYMTFVEEIPQRDQNSSRLLVDTFHDENTYLICLNESKLLGMLAVRAKRPFSLDGKLSDLDSYLPHCELPCEIRLLAIETAYRKSGVFFGLLEYVVDYCRHQEYDIALISGTLRQSKLYHHMGFVPFGPLVGTPEVPFQPMYLVEETFRARLRTYSEREPGNVFAEQDHKHAQEPTTY